MLREWRTRRRMSQLDLASDAEISTKHLSFIETGRSKPSRQMLLNLAGCLDIPLRHRNQMLLAAGFDPVFEERAFLEPAMGQVRRTVESVLAAHDPCPSLAIDRHWTMLAGNRAISYLFTGAEPRLLRPPVNVPRLLLHPAGLATRIVNLGQWRTQMIARLRRQVNLSGDGVLADLLDELRDYPAGPEMRGAGDSFAVPLRLSTIDGVLSFFTATTAFGTPLDITVSELAIETFLPADAETAAVMRRVTGAAFADEMAF